MITLISGLSQSGKSTFAEAVANNLEGYTHVSLDKYILEFPESFTFLEWVDSSRCIDWPLLHEHLKTLKQGKECHAPLFDFERRCKRIQGNGRLWKPAKKGYLIPGCHALKMPEIGETVFKVFVDTPLTVVAGRHAKRKVEESEAPSILDERHSPGWKKILAYKDEADLVISGIDERKKQISDYLAALNKQLSQRAKKA